MSILVLIVSVIVSLFSTIVMSYISMAIPIGPWIDPTIALLAMPLFRYIHDQIMYTQALTFVTSAGSIGGILATGMGFSLPTLYFINPEIFNSWMANPFYFFSIVTSLALAAGGFGLWIANVVEHKFIEEEKLPFPVGQLVYKMISAQNKIKSALQLMWGFLSTILFCILQDGLLFFKGIIPKALTLLPKTQIGFLRIPLLSLDLMPMLWAIGFVTGHVIALPLIVGALSKIVIIDSINTLLFNDISNMEFVLAFGSGMVISGTLMSFIGLPKNLYKAVQKFISNKASNSKFLSAAGISRVHLVEFVILLIFIIGFLSYFKFSLAAQLYTLICTAMCTYEIANQAGKFGMAYLGRFATFVMVPAMFLFNLSIIQIVLIAAFVEICGGVASDILFGRMLARQAHVTSGSVERYQWVGLLVSSLTIGVVFWLLINHFHLGSPELFAIKAQNRQLLINAKTFNFVVLILGFIYGFLLKFAKVNPGLVLGGILMPLNMSFGLIVGGLLTLVTKNKEEWYPLWSGIFAANSVWMLVKALL